MRRTLGTLALSVGAVAATHLVVHSQVAEYDEFTVKIEETRFDSQSGAFADRNVETRAVRADGSIAEVRELTMPDGSLVSKRSVYDAPNHRRVAIDDATESTVTFYHQKSKDGSSSPLRTECGPGAGRKAREILGFQTYQFDHPCASGDWG